MHFHGEIALQLYNIVASFIFRLMVIRGDNPTSKDAIKLICLVSLPVTVVSSVRLERIKTINHDFTDSIPHSPRR